MNETEQLKKNTEEQYARERAIETNEYLATLMKEEEELSRWDRRAMNWMIVISFFPMSVTMLGLYLGLEPEIRYLFSDVANFLFLLVLVRAFAHSLRHGIKLGELVGCIRTLQKLGYLKSDGDKRIKTVMAKNPFRRFKEFFERMKSKDKREAYA